MSQKRPNKLIEDRKPEIIKKSDTLVKLEVNLLQFLIKWFKIFPHFKYNTTIDSLCIFIVRILE